MSSDKNSLKSSLVDFFSRCFPKILVVAVVVAACFVFPASSQSSSFRNRNGITEMDSGISNVTIPNLDINITQPKTGEQVAFSVQLLLLLTVLTLAPSILILTTCFLRFSIVLDFIKRALSLQQVPPTAVLNGIALFMTIFVMWPVLSQIYSKSVKPLSDGQISVEQAYKEAEAPLRIFMYNQMSGKNGGTYIATFMKMAKLPQPKNLSEVPTYVIIPAYILHELTVAFKIGVFLYIPFIVIDMVVASVLMSMGMMMLPPVQISMPFKLMLFVLVDGWGLLTQQLFASVAL
ncbi:MAG: flagellar type III secretion system pore protein FliP [Treponema sp.]|nr:flagellar type III secretion system pore protein FliP [Treponema sp.]